MTSTTNETLQEIINTVLYDGYSPCPPGKIPAHNDQRKRFTIGRIYPEIYCQRRGGQATNELCQFQTEVLLETGNELPELRISLGFLQPIQQEIGAVPRPLPATRQPENLQSGVTPERKPNGRSYQNWMEAVERQITIPLKTFHGSVEAVFNFEGQYAAEPAFDEDGIMTAVVRRVESPISGKIIVALIPLKNGLSKISVSVLNQSFVPETGLDMQDRILMSTMASSHFVLEAKHGRLISFWNMPDELKFFGAQCRNVGVQPVLVGGKSSEECATVLASPVILYDYPQVSRERKERSGGGEDKMPAFDELTITEPRPSEIREEESFSEPVRQGRAAEDDEFTKLHGSGRRIDSLSKDLLKPAKSVKSVLIDGVELSAGDRVYIHPSPSTDPIDLVLAGKTAVIDTLERDFEGQIHLGLVLEGDSEGYLDAAKESGYRFFYSAEEVEPYKIEVAS